MNSLLLGLAVYLLCAIASIDAYGFFGHQLTGQVAMRFLSPKAKQAVSEILPASTDGRLERVAAWADTVKRRPEYRFSSVLHYINPLEDYPPKACTFTWDFGHADVINAIYNYTSQLAQPEVSPHIREDALKFLVHFLGDLHNPLHITGRDRGGNNARAVFEGHSTNLHRIWDSQILNKQVRELSVPYTTHVLNLTRTLWRMDMADWISCPPLDPDAPNYPYHRFRELPVCPEYWGVRLNSLNCKYVWNGYDPLRELSSGDYYQRIEDDWVQEKLIAMAGIRIAGVLNTLFNDNTSVDLHQLNFDGVDFDAVLNNVHDVNEPALEMEWEFLHDHERGYLGIDDDEVDDVELERKLDQLLSQPPDEPRLLHQD